MKTPCHNAFACIEAALRDELHALRTCIAGERNREVLAGMEISIDKIEEALARFCTKRHTMEVKDHV